MFADPFNTAGLVIEGKAHEGFTFEVYDVKKNRVVEFKCPQELYDLLVYIGAPGRYCIKSVKRNCDNEIASVSSTDKVNLIAGRYVGKDDPVCIVRAHSGFPAYGEVVEAFSFPHIVGGWIQP